MFEWRNVENNFEWSNVEKSNAAQMAADGIWSQAASRWAGISHWENTNTNKQAASSASWWMGISNWKTQTQTQTGCFKVGGNHKHKLILKMNLSSVF